MTVATNPNNEWFVVHVSPPESAAAGKKRFQMKGSVLDKLRADFNPSDKRDRCAQLTWSPQLKDPTVWADFVSKMKECVLASLDFHVSSREEDLRKFEAQRQSKEWSFQSFFKLKVRWSVFAMFVDSVVRCMRLKVEQDMLATSFVLLDLLEDAQMQMDELEAIYFQLIKGEIKVCCFSLILQLIETSNQNVVKVQSPHLEALPFATTQAHFSPQIGILIGKVV